MIFKFMNLKGHFKSYYLHLFIFLQSIILIFIDVFPLFWYKYIFRDAMIALFLSQDQ